MSVKRPGSPPTGPFSFAPSAFAASAKAYPLLWQAHIVGGQHVVDELSRRILPTIAERMGSRVTPVQAKRFKRRMLEVGSEHAGRGVGDHVLRPGRGKSGDRDAAGERLEQDEAESVGQARKDKDVRRGISQRKILTVFRSEEQRIGIETLKLL